MAFKELYETRWRQFQLIQGWPASPRYKRLSQWLRENESRYANEMNAETKVRKKI